MSISRLAVLVNGDLDDHVNLYVTVNVNDDQKLAQKT